VVEGMEDGAHQGWANKHIYGCKHSFLGKNGV
jgi:hypothetical protein